MKTFNEEQRRTVLQKYLREQNGTPSRLIGSDRGSRDPLLFANTEKL